MTAENKNHLEEYLKLWSTTYDEARVLLGLEPSEAPGSIKIEDSSFPFEEIDGRHVLTGAVIRNNQFGFFGIQIGAPWLNTARELEKYGLIQDAGYADKFSYPGTVIRALDKTIAAVHLYPDNPTSAAQARVKDYSIVPVPTPTQTPQAFVTQPYTATDCCSSTVADAA